MFNSIDIIEKVIMLRVYIIKRRWVRRYFLRTIPLFRPSPVIDGLIKHEYRRAKMIQTSAYFRSRLFLLVFLRSCS